MTDTTVLFSMTVKGLGTKWFADEIDRDQMAERLGAEADRQRHEVPTDPFALAKFLNSLNRDGMPE